MRMWNTEWNPNVSEFVIDEAAGDVNGGRETEVEGGVALKVDNGDGVMGMMKWMLIKRKNAKVIHFVYFYYESV